MPDINTVIVQNEIFAEIKGGVGAGADNFLQLGDTPTSYVGEGGNFVRVNATEDALEFIASSTSVSWGGITGTLSFQTDLQSALDGKLSSVQAGTDVTIDNTDPQNPIINVSSSGGGATNLGYTAGPTGGTVTSDTGTDAILPLVDSTNAGLMSPGQNDNLALNTSARHNPVTVTNSSEISLSIVGQDITASLIAGSIDETKLDASVNASLDLADSALQSETDPVFSASEAATITNTNTTNWNAAYTHSQITSGNPHNVNKTDVGLGNVDNVKQAPDFDYTDVVFLGKHGNDSNDGLSPDQAVLTANEAEILAEAIIDGGADKAVIHITDPGTYSTGNFTVDDGITLYAPNATFNARLVIRDETKIVLNKLIDDGTAFPTLNKNAGTLNAEAHIDIIDMRGVAGTTTGGIGIRNQGGGGILRVVSNALFVCQGGIGVGDTAGGFGHIHFTTEDLYLAGNNAVGMESFDAGSEISIVARIGHILETANYTGTVGVRASAASSLISVITGEIQADTAIDVQAGGVANVYSGKVTGNINVASGGTLYIDCTEFSGTITNNGTIIGRIGSTVYGGLTVNGFSTAGFVKNNAGGVLSGGNSIVITDVVNLQTELDGKVDENALITGDTKTKITYDSKGLVTAGADAGLDDLSDVVKGAAAGSSASTLRILADPDTDGTYTVVDWTPPTGGGGEANTASNVGIAGVGVFKQKTGVDLEFKNINAGSNKVTITDDTGNNEIDIDVVEANIDLSLADNTTSQFSTYTSADFDTDFASKTTDNLAEGVNKYWDYNADGNEVTNASDPTAPQSLTTQAWVNTELSGKADSVHTHVLTDITDFPSITGNADKFLFTDALTVSWSALSTSQISDLGAWTGSTSITTLGTIATGTWQGAAISIANGGTGQTTQQAAINALTNVAGATNEHVLTKDTATGDAVFKAVSTGATSLNDLTDVTIGTPTGSTASTLRILADANTDGTYTVFDWTPPTGGGGEANTASNIGVGGVGVFDAKVGVDLQFKNINAGSNKVTITDDTGNNEIDIDINETNLTLSNLGGSVTDAQVPNTITLDNITQITNRSHTSLTDIGTNTHAQIDTHISDSTIHFTEGAISITASQVSDFDTEVSNNIDVAANTLARHDAVTLATSATTGGLSLTTQEIGFQAATSLQNGYLTFTDWNTFNDKQDSLTLGNLTESTSSVLTITGGTGAVVGSGTTIQVDTDLSQYDNTTSGFISGITGEPVGDLSDVTITTPANNELLAYDSGTGEWINQTPTEAGFATVATSGAYSDLSGTPTISGTNTGDQDLFSTIAVSGQSNVVADSTSDTLTLVAGTNITITTNAATDEITINSSGSGSPAGSNGQIQFNNSGSFGADSDLFWDATDNELGIGTATPDAHITIEQPGTGGKEFLKINATAAAGRPITFYDNGTFVGGIDYNFSGNYFSFDVTNAGGTRVTDAFVLMSESNDNFLGLGTTSPAYRLDVNGDINISSGSSYRVNGSPLDFSDIAGDVNLASQVTGILPVANGGTGVASSASYTNPTGSMIMYGGSTAPSGWLLCDGSAVSRTTYADLFAVLGTAYGVGNGSTTFNLPDMRGRFPAGRNASDSDFNTLGETGGTAFHSHTATGMGAAIGRGGSTLYLNTSGSNSWNATHVNNLATNWTTSTQSFSDSVDILGSTDFAETHPPYQVFNFIIKT